MIMVRLNLSRALLTCAALAARRRGGLEEKKREQAGHTDDRKEEDDDMGDQGNERINRLGNMMLRMKQMPSISLSILSSDDTDADESVMMQLLLTHLRTAMI